jgi:alpha-beta hydrolase superfamily lysophospholipase
MPHTEHYLDAADGLRLRARLWAPAAPPRALLLLTHGMGEHSSRYVHVAGALTAAGYALAAHDLRGHGRSEGPRGHTPNYAQTLDDIQLVYDWAAGQFPSLQRFLYGHSLGGQLTLSFALDRQPEAAGVIASAPWLRLKPPPPASKAIAGRLINSVWPAFTYDTELGPVPMSHDADHLNSFPELDLTHTRISVRLGVGALDHGLELLRRAPEFERPLLILHGEADLTMDPAGSREFYERAGSADKTFKLYPGFYHEVHNEIERARVLADIVDWLNARG